MYVATYDPAEVQLIVASQPVEGFNYITVTKDAPSFTKVPGIRGKNTRIRNKNSGCSIQVSIIQTSFSNDIFSEIVRKDRLSGKGRIEVILKDKMGSSLFGSDNAYLVDYPAGTFGEAINERVWIIDCLSSYTYRVGGNNRSPLSIFDSLVGGASNILQNL